MEDTITTPNYISKQQKLTFNVPAKHADSSSKFYYHFSFKAMLVLIFLVVLPLFPLEAPEIISKTLHTGSWEILQLILVGIAVSYGLFSKKSDDESDNEYHSNSKFDNVKSRLLEVSSFFYDEAENHSVCDENRVETLSHYQYHSGKPVVVQEKHRAIISSRIDEKPLLLPIRSLKSPVPEPISTTSPKSLSPSQSISSPRKFPFSSESEANIADNIMRKKSFLKSSPPRPPPLPPPTPVIRKSTLLKSSSIIIDEKAVSDKELRRSSRSVPFEGKSVRTIRPFIGAARARVLHAQDFINGKAEGIKNKEVEQTFVDKQMNETSHFVPKPAVMEFVGEEKKVLSVEKVVVETDDYFEESTGNVEVANKNVSDKATESVTDVDKKADQFIAKFRKQIRLQRIESIRTSATNHVK
ncbi:uncharacterized protein LOC107775760 [Nicotiana tabacum]|uniref:Uncharacterized protein LOC107775760 n=2 Tax=Nicotiana TaxID=4085 RepID=A0A1S3YFP5_TOBAC|nr:PREDICTED: uncharacterized protein LOC104236098 [Nicotiana sylvestris]XP_016451019.1 PREDICTED: uncharacterized protein LOC107775760 [Nicotiana tabacum]